MKSNAQVFLKSARESAGLSQRDVANRMGYETPQFISNWERGVSLPPVTAIKKLAEVYKISADALFEVMLNEIIMGITVEMRRKFFSSKRTAKVPNRKTSFSASTASYGVVIQ